MHRSHARAAAAQRSGRFDSQIVPVHTTWKDSKTGEVKNVVIDKDDGIRDGVSVEALSKLPAVFKKGGSTTPGNASQVSDGAGCVVLARRSYAQAKGLDIMGEERRAKHRAHNECGKPINNLYLFLCFVP